MLHPRCKLEYTSNTYIRTKVSKLVCELTELTNSSRRSAMQSLLRSSRYTANKTVVEQNLALPQS